LFKNTPILLGIATTHLHCVWPTPVIASFEARGVGADKQQRYKIFFKVVVDNQAIVDLCLKLSTMYYIKQIIGKQF